MLIGGIKQQEEEGKIDSGNEIPPDLTEEQEEKSELIADKILDKLPELAKDSIIKLATFLST